MIDKNPNALEQSINAMRPVMPWISSITISVIAAAAQYAERVRNGERPEWRLFILDVIICVFVGLVTHMVCMWAGVEGWGQSVAVALSAHMGTRALLQYERIRDRILGLDKP